MKCVKNSRGIIRVPDDEAAKLVKESEYSYTSKTEWKKATRPSLGVTEDGTLHPTTKSSKRTRARH